MPARRSSRASAFSYTFSRKPVPSPELTLYAAPMIRPVVALTCEGTTAFIREPSAFIRVSKPFVRITR